MIDGFDGLLDGLADTKCDVEGCTDEARRETSTGRGLCVEHHDRREALGDGRCVWCLDEPAEDGSRLCSLCAEVGVGGEVRP